VGYGTTRLSKAWEGNQAKIWTGREKLAAEEGKSPSVRQACTVGRSIGEGRGRSGTEKGMLKKGDVQKTGLKKGGTEEGTAGGKR